MKSLANVVGGKTARACDSCVRRRARWYCSADDAFLCQTCDGSVHSANPLARRHERVRLNSASSAGKHRRTSMSPPHTVTWHHGFTRKARTPRGGSKKTYQGIFHDLVPEIEDQTESYDEEQMICQVPVLDPMATDAIEEKSSFGLPTRVKRGNIIDDDDDHDNAESCLNGFFPTDMELAAFAADVESLLGRGIEAESFVMDDGSSGRGRSSIFKVEKEEELLYDRHEMDTAPFELSFDYESHKICEDDDDHDDDEDDDECKGNLINERNNNGNCKSQVEDVKEKKNVLMLRLNYGSVISTWAGQVPPWTAGDPPELDLDNVSWPISMGDNGAEVPNNRYTGGFCEVGFQAGTIRVDGGREARVSRYREKRRTRLFSKKIRYEVRKINAEKRPRMKGRFVKRLTSSFPVITK